MSISPYKSGLIAANGHEVTEGDVFNIRTEEEEDVKTYILMVYSLEQDFGGARFVWISDTGGIDTYLEDFGYYCLMADLIFVGKYQEYKEMFEPILKNESLNDIIKRLESLEVGV